MKRIWVLVLVLSLLLGACGSENGMEAHEAWTRPAAQGDNAAVYFTFHNHSSKADELTGALVDIAETVEIHQSTLNGDVAEMKPVDSVSIGAFADLEFAPGGLHLMLVNLKKALTLGEQFQITLHFKNSRDIKMRVSVSDAPPPGEEGSSTDH